MEGTSTIKKESAAPSYLCPKHLTRLLYVLRGGAGYCTGCALYVQAMDVPLPTLDKPETKTKAKRRTKATSKRKPQKAKTATPEIRPNAEQR